MSIDSSTEIYGELPELDEEPLLSSSSDESSDGEEDGKVRKRTLRTAEYLMGELKNLSTPAEYFDKILTISYYSNDDVISNILREFIEVIFYPFV